MPKRQSDPPINREAGDEAGTVSAPDGDRVTYMRALGHTVRVSQRAGTNPTTPPLVLLMGLGGNIEMWEPLRTELSLQGLTTIGIDVPGTGKSPAPKLPLPLVLHAMLVLSVIRQLDLPKVDLMGLSWGGLLAQQVAVMARSQVRRVVLLSTNVGLGSVPGKWLTVRTLLNESRYHSHEGMAAAAAAFGGDTSSAVMPHHPHAKARLALPPSKRGYYYQLLSPVGWSSLPWLWLVKQPTYVVCGDDDPAVPAFNARLLAALIPGAKLELIAGGGHLLSFEQPHSIADSVTRFLREPPSTDTYRTKILRRLNRSAR